jgi:hypothetical protein
MATPLIRNDAERDELLQLVEAEMARGVTEVNEPIILETMTAIEAYEASFDQERTTPGLIQQGALQGQAPAVAPQEGFSTLTGQQGTIDPQQQLQAQAAGQGASQRLTEFTNVLRRFVQDPETLAQLEQDQALQQAESQILLEESARASGVAPESLDTARTVGQLAPDVALSLGPGGITARTAIGSARRVASEAAIGGFLGAASAPIGEGLDFLTDVGLPAAGAGTLGAVFEIPIGVRNFILNETRQALNAPTAVIGREVEEITGIPFSPAERADSIAAARAEAAVATVEGGHRQSFLDDRNPKIFQSFERLDEAMNPERLSMENLIRATDAAVQRHAKELKQDMRLRFQRNLSDAADPVGARVDPKSGDLMGGQRFVSAENLIAELKRQRELATEPLSGVNASAFDAEIKLLEEEQALGGLQLGELQRRLSDFTDGPRNVVKDVDNAKDHLNNDAILAALFRDMEATGRRNDLDGEVLDALNAARTQYSHDLGDVRRLEELGTDKLLAKVLTGPPEAAVRQLSEMSPESYKRLLDTLDKYSPGKSRNLRSRQWFELVDAHTTRSSRLSRPGEEGVPEVDTAGLIADINKMSLSRLEAFAGHNLGRADTARLHAGLQALQKIAKGPEGSAAGQSNLDRIRDFAINLISQSSEFVTRFVAGQAAPGALERMIFTEEGQRALMNLGDPRVKSTALAQSLNFFANAIRENDEQVAQMKAELEAEASRQRNVFNPAMNLQ